MKKTMASLMAVMMLASMSTGAFAESRYSNWDGFMDSKEYTGCYGYEPTYLSFSEDSYVK